MWYYTTRSIESMQTYKQSSKGISESIQVKMCQIYRELLNKKSDNY